MAQNQRGSLRTEDGWVGIDQFAETYRLTRASVYRLVAKEDLPFESTKVEHRIFINPNLEKRRVFKPIELSQKDLEKVLIEHPTLGVHGFWHPECGIDLPTDRLALSNSLERVEQASTWVQQLKKRKTLNNKAHSYSLKRDAERELGVHFIPNGCLIAAALIAGFRCQMIPDTPNCIFDMTTWSVITTLGRLKRYSKT